MAIKAIQEIKKLLVSSFTDEQIAQKAEEIAASMELDLENLDPAYYQVIATRIDKSAGGKLAASESTPTAKKQPKKNTTNKGGGLANINKGEMTQNAATDAETVDEEAEVPSNFDSAIDQLAKKSAKEIDAFKESLNKEVKEGVEQWIDYQVDQVFEELYDTVDNAGSEFVRRMCNKSLETNPEANLEKFRRLGSKFGKGIFQVPTTGTAK